MTDSGKSRHGVRTAKVSLGWQVRSACGRHVLRMTKNEIQSLTLYKASVCVPTLVKRHICPKMTCEVI
jgi:hypothetical protein